MRIQIFYQAKSIMFCSTQAIYSTFISNNGTLEQEGHSTSPYELFGGGRHGQGQPHKEIEI